MSWIIKIPDGPEVESDDFLLSHLGQIESEADAFWSTANPFRSSKVARAFMRVALEIAGRDPAEADTYTMKVWKQAFDFKPDGDEGEEEPERPTKSRRKPTSRGSSDSSPPATTGPHLSAASSA